MKSPDEKVLIKGFYDKVEVLSENDKAALEKMIYSEQDTLERLGLDSFLLNLSGVSLKEKLIFQPTCTICGFVSGYIGEGSKTVLPSEARVKIDFRLVPKQDPQEILQLLRQHLDEHGFSDIEIQSFSMEHPARTELDNPLARSILETVKDVYGKDPTVMPMSPGTGPMYVICQSLGIPSVSVGVGHFGSNNHAPNENIFVDDYVEGIKHIAAIIDDFANRE